MRRQSGGSVVLISLCRPAVAPLRGRNVPAFDSLKSAHSKGDNGQGVIFVSNEHEKFGGCSEMAIPMRDLSKSDALNT
jgi:hypothetical protein